MVIEECVQRDIGALTLFVFSSENWGRPRAEVMSLMSLFVESLEAEVSELHRNGVRLRFIGERTDLDARLRASMANSEQITAGNSQLNLQIALSYGGRSDIVSAARRLASQVERHELKLEEIDAPTFAAALSLGGLPDPDLFIRTGGEQRISNFCSGTWPIPSCTSPTVFGRISMRRALRRRCSTSRRGADDSGSPSRSSPLRPRRTAPARLKAGEARCCVHVS
jgi:undecaprenyl diphosphate synthase